MDKIQQYKMNGEPVIKVSDLVAELTKEIDEAEKGETHKNEDIAMISSALKLKLRDVLEAISKITLTPNPTCKFCHGSGTYNEFVPAPFGSGNVPMPTDCDCIFEKATDEELERIENGEEYTIK